MSPQETFYRYGVFLAELEGNCFKIFKYKHRRQLREKMQFLVERRLRPNWRRPYRGFLPSTSDKHIQLLRKVLAPGIYSQNRHEMDWIWNTGHVNIERAILLLHYVDGFYRNVIDIIRMIDFTRWDRSLYLEINVLWYNSIYHHEAKERYHQLDQTGKLNLRITFPSPLLRLTGNFRCHIPERALQILNTLPAPPLTRASSPKEATASQPMQHTVKNITAADRLYHVYSSDPARPNEYLEPIQFEQLTTGNGYIRKGPPPDREFDRCPGDTLQSNRVIKVTQHQSAKRLMFYTTFEMSDGSQHFKGWIDFEVLRKLEPKHVLTDYLRSLFLFHQDRWKSIKARFIKPDLSQYSLKDYITDDLERLRENMVKERVRMSSLASYHRHQSENDKK